MVYLDTLFMGSDLPDIRHTLERTPRGTPRSLDRLARCPNQLYRDNSATCRMGTVSSVF